MAMRSGSELRVTGLTSGWDIDDCSWIRRVQWVRTAVTNQIGGCYVRDGLEGGLGCTGNGTRDTDPIIRRYSYSDSVNEALG